MAITGRRRVHGYFDMGKPRVPPLPAIVGLTDRSDGTIWYLTHDATFTHVALDNDISAVNQRPQDRWQDILVYDPFDGPWLDTHVQLMVRSGRIGYDFHEITEQGVTFYGTPTPWTRRKVERQHFRIHMGSAYHAEGDPLSFSDDG